MQITWISRISCLILPLDFEELLAYLLLHYVNKCYVLPQVCIDVIVQRLGDATAAGMYKLLFSTLHGRTSTVSLYALPVRI
jgi:hypothetical protein